MNQSIFLRLSAFAAVLGILIGCTPAKTSNTTTTAPSVKASSAAPALPVSSVKFDTDLHDFGKITEGEKVSYRYTFTNTGTNPLKITNVKPTCGCTTPEWSKDEIAPSGTGYIVVEFDSKGRKGTNNKTIEVFANTEPEVTPLRFTAEVTPAKK